MSSLAALGADPVVSMSKNLRPNAQNASDLKERYAISGLAHFAGRDNSQKVVAELETGFLQALDQCKNIEVEVFLLEQMSFFATDKSIPLLSAKISTVCEPAVHALASIGTEKAFAAILKAQAGSRGYCLEVITKILAESGTNVGLQALMETANNDEDKIAQKTALRGLSLTGNDAAFDPLMGYARQNPSEGNNLLLGLGLSHKGKSSHLNAIIEHVLSTGSDVDKISALRLATSKMGAGANKTLKKVVRKESPAVAAAAALIIGNHDKLAIGPYFKYISGADPQVQTALLGAAAIEKHKGALPKARELLSSDHSHVQVAAVRALSEIGGPGSIVDLQKVLTRSTNGQEVRVAAVGELSRWITAENQSQLGSMLNLVPAEAKTDLIRLVASRKMSSLWPNIEPLLQSKNPSVRKAAFAAIQPLEKGISTNDLVALVSLAESEQEIDALQRAFRQKALSSQEPDQISNPLIQSFGISNPGLLGKILPGIGGPKALQYIKTSTDKIPLLSWKSSEALGPLFSMLASNPNNRDIFIAAKDMVMLPEVNHVQRDLYLRELMNYAHTPNEKREVIGLLGSTHSFVAFNFVKAYLTDSTLETRAAHSLLQMALPPNGESVGLYGSEVQETLWQVKKVLSGRTNDYTMAFLDNYLSTMPKEESFRPMFNGKDLDGWQGLVDNPIVRDTLMIKTLKEKQEHANKELQKNWKVEGGVIKFIGSGYDNLCSVDDYKDFELLVDWKIGKKGDSGIYLRGTPQVQIWDTSLVEVGAQVGSGGLYNNQSHESKPLSVADNPVGQWNNFRIIMLDNKVTVYLNGVRVTDNVVLENFWDRNLRIFREGPIELQAHGSDIQFRDIYVREIESVPTLSGRELEDNFELLFNGENLDGWVGNKADYVVENGEIVIYPGPGSGNGNLYTAKEYDDFILKFEFKLTPGANNGLGIHTPLEGDAAYVGKEIQILDNTAEKYKDLKEYQYHGSVYGLVPAQKGALKPVGEWNQQEVSVSGNQIRVVLNGERILFDNLDHAARNGTLDGREHPGLQRTKGHIGFLGHGSEVHFRNIKIKELIKDPKD